MTLELIYPKSFAENGQIHMAAVTPTRETEQDDNVHAEIELEPGSYFIGLNVEHKIGVFPDEPAAVGGHAYSRVDVADDELTVHNFGGTYVGERPLEPGESVTLQKDEMVSFPTRSHSGGIWHLKRVS